jgi:hypothetical protein
MKALYLKLCFALPMLVACTGCTMPTRAQVRSGLLLVARATVEVNQVCASVARTVARENPKAGLDLAEACTKITRSTFHGLEAGETALDAFQANKALCAVSSGLSGVLSVMKLAKVSFGDSALPKSIEDAVTVGQTLASLVAGKCEVQP